MKAFSCNSHGAVSSSSMMVKRLLEVAGVDTSIFTGHSVRVASLSIAYPQ